MRLLADMALFVEVANTRHFARAAAALDIPPSTLSRRIAALEAELGVTLIRRSTRSFALTDAGTLCYERARKLIAEAGRIREDLGESAGAISGHIRIGLQLDLAQTIFLPIFTEFVRRNPGVTVELLSVHGYPNLLTESLDLAFLPAHQTAMPDSSQWSRRIGSFSRKLFASQGYLRSRRPPAQPAELKDHDCLLFSLGTVQKQWELRRGRERCTITVTGTAAANSVGLLASLARADLGVALLPDFLARDPGFGGGLVHILPEWEGVPAYVFAVTPGRMLPAKTRKLVEFAKAQFQPTLLQLEAR